jgi:MFS family permease
MTDKEPSMATTSVTATPPFLARLSTMLQNGDYRRLLSSNALWWQAMFMETVVVGWLVLEMTNSPWQVSLVGFCRSAPFLVCGFVSGPLTDRVGRRTIILAAQLANFLCYVLIALLLWSGQLALWHMYITALVLGVAWALDWPARRALLPDLIGKAKTVDAMLMENFAQSTSRIIGPALAGALIAGFGPPGCYTAMLILSGIALWNLRHLSQQPIPRTTMRPSASPWNLVAEGLRYVGHNQAILGVILITLVMNLLYFPYMNMLPVFARDVLGQGPVGLGLLGAASGVGALLGLFIINRIRQQVSSGWILTVGTFAMSLCLLAFALSRVYSFSWAMLLFAGIGQACFGIMQSSIILLATSDEMRSRAMGTLVLAIGSDPLGKLQTGYLAELYGVQMTVALQAGLAALAILLIGVTLPGLRRPIAESGMERQGAVADD